MRARLIKSAHGKAKEKSHAGDALKWYELGEPDPRKITPRELEVMWLTSHGWTDEKIAEALGIAFCTVRTHWNKIFDKTRSKNRCDAVARAIRNGTLDKPPVVL